VGYAPWTETIFTGYVSKVVPDSPATVHCENEAFVWKQKSLGAFTGRNLKISELIRGVGYGGLLSLGSDPIVGDWAVQQNTTIISILDELRNKFGLLSYWRKDKTLYIAEDFDNIGLDQKFSFQRNIISHNLDFITNAGDVQPVSHGVSVQKNNTKIERYAYYLDNDIVVSSDRPAGVLNTMSIQNISQNALDSLIIKRLPRLRNQGIKGAFTAFGLPLVEHGDNAVLINNKFPDLNGAWKIKSVETTHGVDGYRQVIELDQKLA